MKKKKTCPSNPPAGEEGGKQQCKCVYSAEIARWMKEGVTFRDPFRTFVGPEVKIGQDTVVYPDVYLEGKTKISKGCVLYRGSRIADSTLGDFVTVLDLCVIEKARIGSWSVLGPFAHIRQGAVLGPCVKIGNFVEIKKSSIGKESKVSHLAYVGDAKIGKRVNVGAGVITCNYDGKKKHTTIVEDDAFVGSNVQLVAPVRVGKRAVVAAGSTITDDVPKDTLAIARARQVHKRKKRKQTKKK